jgi:hypothetical protein
MIPTPSVKIEVTTSSIKQVVRYSNCNIHAEFRRIDELRRFIKINFLRRWVLSWRWQHLGWGWRWYLSLRHNIWRSWGSHNIGWRWRRCSYCGLRRRGYYTTAVSRHLIPIGIHALNIGIVISALCPHAIDLA